MKIENLIDDLFPIRLRDFGPDTTVPIACYLPHIHMIHPTFLKSYPNLHILEFNVKGPQSIDLERTEINMHYYIGPQIKNEMGAVFMEVSK